MSKKKKVLLWEDHWAKQDPNHQGKHMQNRYMNIYEGVDTILISNRDICKSILLDSKNSKLKNIDKRKTIFVKKIMHTFVINTCST